MNITNPVILGIDRKNDEHLNVVIDQQLIKANEQETISTGIYYLYAAAIETDFDEYLTEEDPSYLGKILFDNDLNWIYDGEFFSVNEQEQIGEFIKNYTETDVDF
jgi:hypothetical protein